MLTEEINCSLWLLCARLLNTFVDDWTTQKQIRKKNMGLAPANELLQMDF